jgi:hypothetical protein
MEMHASLEEFLSPSTPKFGNHLAVVGHRQWLTHSQLQQRIGELAGFLLREGVVARHAIGIAVRKHQTDLLLKLALARIGAGIVTPVPDRVLDGAPTPDLDRVVVDQAPPADRGDLFIQLPAEQADFDAPQCPPRKGDPERDFYLAPPRNPNGEQPAVWLTEAMAWERMLAVTAGIKPHTRVAFCGLQEPARTLLPLGVLARGGTIMFLPARGLSANLARYGADRLIIRSAVANRLVSNPRVPAFTCTRLQAVQIHGSRPVPGLALGFGARFGGTVRFAIDDPRLGPVAVSDAGELETSPLGLQGVLPDMEISIAAQGRAEGETPDQPTPLLVRHRLGDWRETEFCVFEDPDRGPVITGRTGRVRRLGGLWLETRLVEQVLKTHEGVDDVMVFYESRIGDAGKSTAVMVADHPCTDSLLAHGRKTLGVLAPGKVIQIELAGLDPRRGYLRNLLSMLAGADDKTSFPGVVSISEQGK